MRRQARALEDAETSLPAIRAHMVTGSRWASVARRREKKGCVSNLRTWSHATFQWCTASVYPFLQPPPFARCHSSKLSNMVTRNLDSLQNALLSLSETQAPYADARLAYSGKSRLPVASCITFSCSSAPTRSSTFGDVCAWPTCVSAQTGRTARRAACCVGYVFCRLTSLQLAVVGHPRVRPSGSVGRASAGYGLASLGCVRSLYVRCRPGRLWPWVHIGSVTSASFFRCL
ncbi:hypothetical protein C8Q73DRAFT_379567 [Cubamyces lactineus]|nr:hypothetical protein C8Q73DRAFT_379567 [Cubamyces lactineus]